MARLSGKGETLIGTSWMYHFEFQQDRFLTFFGQAGQSTGQEKDVKIAQTVFGGGAEVHFPLIISQQLVKIAHAIGIQFINP